VLKTCNSLTRSNKMTFQMCDTAFQAGDMKNFLVSAVFQSVGAFTTQPESLRTRKSVTLQNRNFRSPAKKFKVDRKNVIHSKSKQLHFNVAANECDLK